MKTVSLAYKPHDKQKEIHLACSKESPFKFITVVAGRQGGKSKAAQIQTIVWALEESNVIVWVVSPTESQSKKFYKDISIPLCNSGLVIRSIESKGSLLLELRNGSIIEFKSILSKDSLRGATVDYIVVDEGAFQSGETVKEVLLPMMVTKPKAKMLIVTTPKGKNWVYDFYMTNSSKYKSIKFTSQHNPVADLDYLEELRKTMNKKLYEQEILAEFVDSASVFDNVYELCCLKPYNNRTDVYVGIDIGMMDDSTVITIMDNTGNQLLIESMNHTTTLDIINKVKSVYNNYNVIDAQIELNNQGRPIYDMLIASGINIRGFNTTNDSKSRIINDLIVAFNTKSIRLLEDKELIKQLESFIFKFTATGKIQYEAANGSHDDIVMALAICYNTYKNGMSSNIISVA